MTEISLSKHYLQIDIIKAIAILFVLIIHATSLILYQSNYVICALTLNVAIPVFILLMGRNAGASFKKKRFNHT
jgi:surface polysaccharide O-acyltransferase-like enzyme